MGGSSHKRKKERPDPERALSAPQQERLLTILDGVETASDRSGCDEFCAGVVEAAAGDEELAVALARRLGALATPLSATILSLLLDRHADRRVVKEAKRSLYRLKKRGVDVPGPSATPAARPAKAGTGFGGAYAGVFDPQGRRFVTGAVKIPGQGLLSCATVMSFERGPGDWQSRSLSAKKWREFVALVKEDSDSPLVELDGPHLRLLLEEARDAAETRAEPLPQSFFDFLALLPDAAASRPPVYELFDRDEIAADQAARDRAGRLHEEPLFGAWVLMDIASTLERVKSALGGTLVVSQASRAEWIENIIAEDVDGVFDQRRRQCYARRLEETAFILARQGRDEVARSALAAAIEAAEADSLAHSPFFTALLDRSVRLHLPELAGDGDQGPPQEPARTEGGLIIPGGGQ